MQDDLHLRLFEARSMTIDEGWNTADVQSSYWRFYRNDADGAALLRPGDAIYPLEAERLYFIPSGVRFTCHCAGAVGHLYAHFDVIGLPGAVQREWFGGPVVLARKERLEAEAALLAATPLDGWGGQCRMKSLIYAALASAFEAVPAQTAARWRRLAQDLAPVRPALDFIDAHLEEPLDNARLAALCCVSEDYFIRRFRECLGDTPNRYVQERRAQRAAQMLLFTGDSIDRIAERCGYGSRAYFSRQFARYTGVSPAAYRAARRV